jgi:tyrosine-protein kinase Etk/Wzc
MSEPMLNSMQPNSGANENGKIYLSDLLSVLVQQRKIVIATPIVTGTLALVAGLLMTPMFTSTAKIMPPQQQQGSGMAAMLGQLGGLGPVAGGLGLRSPNELYVGLLESRTVADNLITRFKLKERYEASSMDATRKHLANNSIIATGKKDGFITIAAIDKDPQFAADLANAYVEQLIKLTQTLALTEASQRRNFFEIQLKSTKDQLANAEVALRTTQEKTGMILPEGQVQAIITSVAQLKGAIAAKEVEVNAMRTFAADKNPELLRAQEELRSLQAQQAKLENSRASKSGDFMVPTGKIPEVGVEYIRSVREVKYYEAMFELLAKQFELAKIDEAKQSSVVQVLDKAIPADHKFAPKRALITVAGFIGGAVLGLVFAFLNAAYHTARQNPATRTRWQHAVASWKKNPPVKVS